MIDFHTHILPGIDDGSRSTEESAGLLSLLRQQGVDTVVATPHFNADRITPREFFRRRTAAQERLSAEDREAPRLLMGAEAAYFDGIGHSDIVEDLCIEGTRTLLLEMPFTQWTPRMLDEVENIQYQRDIRVVLAHIERYLSGQSPDICRRVFSDGLSLQINADTLLSLRTRRMGLRLIESGRAHILGSDCHGLQYRPPRMAEAVAYIRKKLGDPAAERMDEAARELLMPEKAMV